MQLKNWNSLPTCTGSIFLVLWSQTFTEQSIEPDSTKDDSSLYLTQFTVPENNDTTLKCKNFYGLDAVQPVGVRGLGHSVGKMRSILLLLLPLSFPDSNESHHIFYTRHIVTTSDTEPYTYICSLMKIFQMVFKIVGIVALTTKGR